MSDLIDKMNQQFTDMQKLANDFHAMAEQALKERDAARERVTRLEGALQAIVDLDDGDNPDLWPYQSEFAAGRNALEGK